jgi:hypothetical protein
MNASYLTFRVFHTREAQQSKTQTSVVGTSFSDRAAKVIKVSFLIFALIPLPFLFPKEHTQTNGSFVEEIWLFPTRVAEQNGMKP